MPRGDCIRQCNRCPTLFESQCSLLLGSAECTSPTTILNDLLSKTAVRSDRLCILVAGQVDAFVTALNLRRTIRVPGLNFKELTNGRIKMITALCPAWAHTYQTTCLGFHLDQLKPKMKFTVFWTFRSTARMTGIESPGCRLFTETPDGTEMAGWEIAAVSPDNLSESFVAQFCVIPANGVFRGPRLAATPLQDSLVWP